MKRAWWAGLVLGGLVLGGEAMVACVSSGDLPPAGPATGQDASTTTTGKADGQTCGAGAECNSGSCVDGVCCESACDQTCEACNVPGQVGKCAPIPDGEDPASECPTTPLPDAGVPEGGDPDAGDGGDLDGSVYVTPDGGVTLEDNQCAGKCDGKRACKYAGAERTCGTITCGSTTTQGRAACDGAGHCLYGYEECKAYACPDGSQGCKSTCTSESDCLSTHFCEATTSTCKPKLGNGSACGSLTQCQSGFCVSGVCCNDSCNGFPGASCTEPGKVGQCVCNACPGGGTCKLFYRDEDGDGYGDKLGTLAPGGNDRARPYCADGSNVPSGWVGNNTDCFDSNVPIAASVFPGQTQYFATAYNGPSGSSFDYNCSGVAEKYRREFPGGSCKPCSEGKGGVCTDIFKCGLTSTTQSRFECLDSRFGVGCTGTTTGFLSVVACGSPSTLYTCQACSGGSLPLPTTTPNTIQTCH